MEKSLRNLVLRERDKVNLVETDMVGRGTRLVSVTLASPPPPPNNGQFQFHFLLRRPPPNHRPRPSNCSDPPYISS